MLGIFKDGIASFFYTIDGTLISGKKAFFCLVVCPFLVSSTTGLYIILSESEIPDIPDILLAALGLFAALVFCVLFIIPDKFIKRKGLLKEKADDASKNYLIRFENFSKIAVRQMLLFLVVGILLTICLIIQKITGDFSFFLIGIYLFTIIVILTLFTLLNIYTLVKDEMKITT